MSLSEKAAYLKGLADGMKLGSESDMDKLLRAIIDTIGETADAVDSLDDEMENVCEELDMLESDLYEDDSDEEDDEEEDEDDEEVRYAITCPKCGAEVVASEDEILDGDVACPECGTAIEFEIIDEADEDQ